MNRSVAEISVNNTITLVNPVASDMKVTLVKPIPPVNTREKRM
jgi:hypothetical protein